MNHDIKIFIDFFYQASIKIRNAKPSFIRGKDGKLIRLALVKLSEIQLEMLAVWFLAKKPKMQATIGAMLSRVVLEELIEKIKDPSFWKELDEIYEKHFSRQTDFNTIKKNETIVNAGELINILYRNANTKRG